VGDRVMKYNFREARNRVEELKRMYRGLAHVQVKDGTWDWWLKKEITILENEIQAAHKKKKTA